MLVLTFISYVIAADTYYSTWPEASGDTAANQKITDDLNAELPDKNKLYVSQSKTLGVMHWYAPLSDALKSRYDTFAG